MAMSHLQKQVCRPLLFLLSQPTCNFRGQEPGILHSSLPIAVLRPPGSSRHCWLPDTLFVTCAMRKKQNKTVQSAVCLVPG